MSFSLQTPQRPLPGAYIQTPALNKYRSSQQAQSNLPLKPATTLSPHELQGQSHALIPHSQQAAQEVGKFGAESLKPIERAAKTINETLSYETRYPELDSYIGRKLPKQALYICVTNWPQRGSLQTMISPRRQHGPHSRK